MKPVDLRASGHDAFKNIGQIFLIELVWRDPKAPHLARQTFADDEALEQAVDKAVEALNSERKPVALDRL